MKNTMCTLDQASAIIANGRPALIAGSEDALALLPCGNWIGGTAVYFLTEEGGVEDVSRVFVTEIDEAIATRIEHLDVSKLPGLAGGRFEHGFSALLVPGFSKAHRAYALDAPDYHDLFLQPVAGWVAGVPLSEIGRRKPLVFDGRTQERHEDGAMVMHVALASDTTVVLDIVNLFLQDTAAGLSFVFAEDGFAARQARVDGELVDLASFYEAHKLDTRLPLVANYAGALINVSIESVSTAKGQVDFYAPVVKGVTYQLAKPVPNYADAFAHQVRDGEGNRELSFNCVLNYVYADLAGKCTGSFTGPATFGEIAYILLNQTMVRLRVDTAEFST